MTVKCWSSYILSILYSLLNMSGLVCKVMLVSFEDFVHFAIIEIVPYVCSFKILPKSFLNLHTTSGVVLDPKERHHLFELYKPL